MVLLPRYQISLLPVSVTKQKNKGEYKLVARDTRTEAVLEEYKSFYSKKKGDERWSDKREAILFLQRCFTLYKTQGLEASNTVRSLMIELGLSPLNPGTPGSGPAVAAPKAEAVVSVLPEEPMVETVAAVEQVEQVEQVETVTEEATSTPENAEA
jgi:L-fucose mutarotase/ribose pyranase (RbsD/FucU family)